MEFEINKNILEFLRSVRPFSLLRRCLQSLDSPARSGVSSFCRPNANQREGGLSVFKRERLWEGSWTVHLEGQGGRCFQIFSGLQDILALGDRHLGGDSAIPPILQSPHQIRTTHLVKNRVQTSGTPRGGGLSLPQLTDRLADRNRPGGLR